MSPSRSSRVVLSDARREELASLELSDGELVAYTCVSPDKLSDNEDTVGALAIGDDAGVIALADGAGGMPAGRRASRLAVDTLLDSIAASSADSLRSAVIDGLEAANAAVLGMLNGAATTMTIVTIEGRQVRAFQVGDSEAMVTGQRGKLKLYTTPHSPTGFAVQAGYLDADSALFHPERHLVSNFVGMSTMTIDVGVEQALAPFDTLLLASDGLTDNLFRSEILDCIRAGPIDDALEALVLTSRRRMQEFKAGQPGKPDDLSVVLYRPRRRGGH